MGDECEKTCPLCAEEMDLTDQQLKPCKCGYEICVWCWHHIMDMAEKDEMDGRCPACRMPYDKEKIVGTAASCERLVAEVNFEKKQKSQKAKTKTSESKKQLSSVRVIQKNLVYIVGLPLDLADEDLLQHREYFAQYGKVLKVSISRTSAGTIQQFANNTCSVYITYSKEEEAVRCIQSVHGFILDGRSLRACFGTTKYCHAWLRNAPCNNPDCLYLHEIGSQEDSFTKDEIISAYTRSRVQQITGFTNNVERRSGNLLPPPVDDYCNDSAPVVAKAVVKNSANNSISSVRGSSPNSSSGKSGGLPAAASWGSRASNGIQTVGGFACSNGQIKQKAEVKSGPQVLSRTVSSNKQASVPPCNDVKKTMSINETYASQTKSKLDMLDIEKQHPALGSLTNASDVSSTPLAAAVVKSANQSSSTLPAESNAGNDVEVLKSKHSSDVSPSSEVAERNESSVADEKIQNICCKISSMNMDNSHSDDHSWFVEPNNLHVDNILSSENQVLQYSEKYEEHPISVTATSASSSIEPVTFSDVCDQRLDKLVMQNIASESEDDFENQRLRDAIFSQTNMPPSSQLHLLSHTRGLLQQQHVDDARTVDCIASPPILNRLPDENLVTTMSNTSVVSNGFLGDFNHASSQGNSSSISKFGQRNHIRMSEGGLPNVGSQVGLDMGESSIIANILDLDSWDESLVSPQNLAKLLGETDNQDTPIKNSWKGQVSNQSRFSFARQENSRNHLFGFESSHGNMGQVAHSHPSHQTLVGSIDPFLDRLGNGFGFPLCNVEQSENLASGSSAFSMSSRSQISAPPGFAAPCRPPPPGFTLHERSDQYSDVKSGDHLLAASALLRNSYQASPNGSISSSNDIEFIDPAILAVGTGRFPINANMDLDMKSNFHLQTSAFENDSRLQLLIQRSLSPHQNLRYTDVRDNFSSTNETYGFNPRHMQQTQASNISPFTHFSLQQARNSVVPNGHWDSWNEVQVANDVGIVDLLKTDRVGFNKFGMTNSGDIYNRTFRM